MLSRRKTDEEGQATLLLLVGMVIAILAVTMLLVRIGHANDLRTQAREASDAAALAAVSTVRDQAAGMIKENVAPVFVQIGGDGETAAKSYAERNHSVVTKYQGAGAAALVSVRTRECMSTEKGGGKFSAEQPCVRTDTNDDQKNKKGQRSATATSAAMVDMPSCFNEPVYGVNHALIRYRINCTPPGGGQQIDDAALLSLGDIVDKLFDVHLSDSFNPNPVMPFLGGGVPDLPSATDPQRRHNEELGQQLAKDLKHWDGEQWHCLDQLWLHESGWNHHAKNPSSGAYGIPQALPASKMSSVGSDWATNPETQIKWGLNYIADRYQTPCNAWAQWQARSPHWY